MVDAPRAPRTVLIGTPAPSSAGRSASGRSRAGATPWPARSTTPPPRG